LLSSAISFLSCSLLTIRIQAKTAIKTAQTLSDISRIATLVIGKALNVRYARVETDADKAKITIPALYFLMYTLDLLLVVCAGTLFLKSTHFSSQVLITTIAATIIGVQVCTIVLLIVKRRLETYLSPLNKRSRPTLGISGAHEPPPATSLA
jgi:hypothetical protein